MKKPFMWEQKIIEHEELGIFLLNFGTLNIVLASKLTKLWLFLLQNSVWWGRLSFWVKTFKFSNSSYLLNMFLWYWLYEFFDVTINLRFPKVHNKCPIIKESMNNDKVEDFVLIRICFQKWLKEKDTFTKSPYIL